jgi:nicotinamide riboside kinase
MKKIGISGVPGSGKTSLARALSAACRHSDDFKNVELVSEYARRYISKHSSIETIWEQYRITEKQIEWEDSIVDSTDILITDSPVYIGFLYSFDLVNFQNPKDLMVYNDLFKKLSKLGNRYDLIVHLAPVIQPIEDGVRPALHFDKTWRDKSDSSLLTIYRMFGQKNVIEITSMDIKERVDLVLESIRTVQES